MLEFIIKAWLWLKRVVFRQDVAERGGDENLDQEDEGHFYNQAEMNLLNQDFPDFDPLDNYVTILKKYYRDSILNRWKEEDALQIRNMVKGTLETILKIDPRHVGAHLLKLEMSFEEGRYLKSNDILKLFQGEKLTSEEEAEKNILITTANIKLSGSDKQADPFHEGHEWTVVRNKRKKGQGIQKKAYGDHSLFSKNEANAPELPNVSNPYDVLSEQCSHS
ncbi:MAG: hypothetical protein A3E85_02970 [Gammaproteobacteria bacterium RIFCSPHIGHO2_12_FULL_45_12]|nr:MAG: hypothetical protein A3E85_02970 [Gammaproteobacteria bacterium RIFCSPHIGHO2_12_FULL_45_12]